MATPQDLIRLAAKSCGALGVGETLLGENLADAFSLLNQMLAQWQVQRWFVYHLLDLACPCVPGVEGNEATTPPGGKMFYTIGPGGDIEYSPVRPDKLEGAYIRQLYGVGSQKVDYTLIQLMSMEDYAQIRLKGMGSFPYWFFYDSGMPLGKVYPYPIPAPNRYELHILVKEVLLGFQSMNEQILLPPMYERAIRLNLAIELAPLFGMDVPPDVAKAAAGAVAVLKAANAQISALTMPRRLTYPSRYNIYSDTSY